ncbi:MAG: histidinol dehydrogenase [Pelagibacteraceae bacterium]|nr:histidinol dehydrogenase [Pelagibacteraceae bacterium]
MKIKIMKIIKEKSRNFDLIFKKLINKRIDAVNKNIEIKVKKIINDVKKYGDTSLIYSIKKFDKNTIEKKDILLNSKKISQYSKNIDPKILKSFKIAVKRINKYHLKQYPKNFTSKEKGISLSQRWTPIDSVGIYVPGGKASYPSSLIMSLIPAKIAGVKRIVVTTPSQKGKFNPYIMAILKLFKIKEVYQIGGAHAIAAMSYGTESIKPVSKIFGPGNIYVSTAKKQIFGKSGIDTIAGPSEIVVVADKKNKPDWIASDLIAQAEHDEKSQSILITDNLNFASKVKESIKRLTKNQIKKKTINQSLENFGVIIVIKSIKNSYKYVNEISPEHLHLQTSINEYIYKRVTNAGAVFFGSYSTESFGDYIAGTNHVLPTSGSARFSSGLGVLDFMKRNSAIRITKKGFKKLSTYTQQMAEAEGLYAHKLSVKIREN